MQKKLNLLLINKYPTLFQTQLKDSPIPVFAGCSCGDGWFTLIDILSELIVARSQEAVATHVKINRLGYLIFRTAGYDDRKDYNYIFGLINMAYSLSELLCEECGENGYQCINSTAKCEQHGGVYLHFEKLPKPPFAITGIGTMWSNMLINLYHQIDMHVKTNGMPKVTYHCVEKRDGKLVIDYGGGDDTTHAMVALLLSYAAKVDEETGKIL